MTPFIIPFFISHQGCPHQCVFCNQRAIAGSSDQGLSAEEIRGQIRTYLAWPRAKQRQVQVAFYGGSFSCLPQQVQMGYLQAVAPFLTSGQVEFVRISTRPDCLEFANIRWLQDHGVGLVEVGVQSLHDGVLRHCERGHTVAQVDRAFSLLAKAGLPAGGQLMVGLPGDTPGRSLASSRRLAAFRPQVVRLYPALVVRGSKLADWYRQGTYAPWSLAQAVAVCAAMKDVFDDQQIRVIRMGLQRSASLEDNVLAGPYHPAFGEMVLSRQFFKKLRLLLGRNRPPGAALHLLLSCRDKSLFTGVNRENYQRLKRLGLLKDLHVHFVANLGRFAMILQENPPQQ